MILGSLVAHQRKIVRKAVASRIAFANTSAGTRVTATRVEPHRNVKLPAISVYTLSESVDPSVSSTREIVRQLRLEVVGWVTHSETVPADDAMDDLAEQIEAAMELDPYFTVNGEASVEMSRLVDTSMQMLEDDGRSDPMVGIVTLTYEMTYRTSRAEPTGLDDFLFVGTTTDLVGGVATTAPASDLITVQEPP